MKKWQKKEKSDADIFKGKRTPRSGGFWAFPGDVRSDKFLIDSKVTEQKSYSINKNIWEKVEHEALKSGKIPILSVSIINDGIELVVLDRNDFVELLKNEQKEN